MITLNDLPASQEAVVKYKFQVLWDRFYSMYNNRILTWHCGFFPHAL